MESSKGGNIFTVLLYNLLHTDKHSSSRVHLNLSNRILLLRHIRASSRFIQAKMFSHRHSYRSRYLFNTSYISPNNKSVFIKGIYNVSAINPAGADFAFTKLTVLIPPEIRTSVSDINVKQGERALLDITVSGKPAPTITWSKAGEVVRNG